MLVGFAAGAVGGGLFAEAPGFVEGVVDDFAHDRGGPGANLGAEEGRGDGGVEAEGGDGHGRTPVRDGGGIDVQGMKGTECGAITAQGRKPGAQGVRGDGVCAGRRWRGLGGFEEPAALEVVNPGGGFGEVAFEVGAFGEVVAGGDELEEADDDGHAEVDEGGEGLHALGDALHVDGSARAGFFEFGGDLVGGGEEGLEDAVSGGGGADDELVDGESGERGGIEAAEGVAVVELECAAGEERGADDHGGPGADAGEDGDAAEEEHGGAVEAGVAECALEFAEAGLALLEGEEVLFGEWAGGTFVGCAHGVEDRRERGAGCRKVARGSGCVGEGEEWGSGRGLSGSGLEAFAGPGGRCVGGVGPASAVVEAAGDVGPELDGVDVDVVPAPVRRAGDGVGVFREGGERGEHAEAGGGVDDTGDEIGA